MNASVSPARSSTPGLVSGETHGEHHSTARTDSATTQAHQARPGHVGTPDQRSGASSLTTAVVCTDGRRDTLRQTLLSLLAQRGPAFEIVVVDNAPGVGRAAGIVSEIRAGLGGPGTGPALRLVTEPRRGLSAARNRGVRAAAGDVIAFTDDDCVVDPGWLAALRRGFDLHPQLSAVTGRTVPDGEPTPVQQLFEDFGSFNRGPDRLLWWFPEAAPGVELDPALTSWAGTIDPPRIYPYAGVFGSGNNMAFTADALAALGPFDEALGAGSPAGGGEDLDMFIRLVLAGRVLLYEPDALILHSHRIDVATLRSQVRSYGSGLSAMITKQLVTDRTSRARILRRTLPGLQHLFSARSPKNARKAAGFPRSLTRAELLGLAGGPFLYLRGRRTARHPARRPAADRPARALVRR